MRQLEREEFEQVRDLFGGFPQHLIVDAVLEGTSPGRIYVDAAAAPRVGLMASAEGHFLAGDAHDETGGAALKRWLTEEIYPAFERRGEWGFDLHYQPPAWGDRFSTVLGVDLPLLFRASYYEFRGLAVDWRRRVPAGFRMQRVDRALLEDASVVNREVVRHKIETNWNSVDDFVERGPGFCLVHGDTIVSECLADCVVGDRCEIGISTDERYRRRGLATLTVAATVEGCLARGLTSIGWHCANNNVASRRTAERVGFEKVAEYPIYWVCFDRQRNLLANGMYSLLVAQQAGRAATLFGEAFGLGEVEARYYYYASAAQALLGEREAAARHLEMALARGLGDGERLEADERLKGVRRTQAADHGEHSPPAPRYTG